MRVTKGHYPANRPNPRCQKRGWLNKKGFKMKKVTLAALTAAAIAASAIVPTSFAYAAPAPAPHYRPLICMLLPTIDVCMPPKPVVHHHHHTMMKKKP